MDNYKLLWQEDISFINARCSICHNTVILNYNMQKQMFLGNCHACNENYACLIISPEILKNNGDKIKDQMKWKN